MKILFYVKRGLYECIKIYFNINFLYNHPKASKRPLIAVPIIMNNPVGHIIMVVVVITKHIIQLLFSCQYIFMSLRNTSCSEHFGSFNDYVRHLLRSYCLTFKVTAFLKKQKQGLGKPFTSLRAISTFDFF